MQEHVYTAQKNRIIKQSFTIWLFVLLQIVMNFMLVPVLIQSGQIWGIVFTNALLGCINIPSMFLFYRYYKHSVGKQFIVTYNTLKYVDTKTGRTTELINTEIEDIYLVENIKMSRLPWLFMNIF